MKAAHTQPYAIILLHVGMEIAVQPASAVPYLGLGASGTNPGIDEALLRYLACRVQLDVPGAKDGRP